MLVKEVIDLIKGVWYFDFPEIEFNDELFPFTIIDEFMIFGPEQGAGEMRKQLAKLSDDFELITAVRIRVKVC